MPRKSSGDGQSSRDELLWLETYFIVFPQKRRPTLAQVEHALAEAGPHLKLENPAANDEGLFQSILVESPEDHAAVEVSFASGEAIIEENLQWAKQLQKQLTAKQLQKFVGGDARFEVAHFERVAHGAAHGGAAKKSDDSAGSASKSARSTKKDKDYDFDDEGDAADQWLAAHDSGGDYGDPYGDSFEEDAEAAMESFDPTCLLTVVEALSSLTKGITLDPASGEIV